MKKSARSTSAKNFLLLCLIVLLVLVFASINIKTYLSPRKVLGIEANNEAVETGSTLKFWQDFLDKNPDYIPGWIEIGRMDKAKEIDPNYSMP